MKILPPRVFQLALISIVAVHFFLPLGFIYHSPVRFFGLFPIFLGSFLNIRSDQLLKKYRTTVKPFNKPDALIEEGPFAWSRNPIYLGMVLIILGGAFISGAFLSFLIPVIFAWVIDRFYIRVEEENLFNVFGDQYLIYKSKVRAWF